MRVADRTFRLFLKYAVPFAMLLPVVGAQIAYVDWQWNRINRMVAEGRNAEAIKTYTRLRGLAIQEPDQDRLFAMALADQAGDNAKEHLAAVIFRASQFAANTAADRHNSQYTLAIIAGRLGNLNEAELASRAAIASAPMWYKPHWLLSELLLASGRSAESQIEAQIAMKLNGGKQPNSVRNNNH